MRFDDAQNSHDLLGHDDEIDVSDIRKPLESLLCRRANGFWQMPGSIRKSFADLFHDFVEIFRHMGRDPAFALFGRGLLQRAQNCLNFGSKKIDLAWHGSALQRPARITSRTAMASLIIISKSRKRTSDTPANGAIFDVIGFGR